MLRIRETHHDVPENVSQADVYSVVTNWGEPESVGFLYDNRLCERLYTHCCAHTL